jgi:regulator of CtrA degradation
MKPAEHTPITQKVVDSLYTEAMLLADEARSYFDSDGQAERQALDPVLRVAYSCESLRVTTRLMHVVSWLLVRKAVAAGEMTEAEGETPERRLGRAGDSELDPARLRQLPPRAVEIIEASRDLYDRVRRLDGQMGSEATQSPARALLGRLERSL